MVWYFVKHTTNFIFTIMVAMITKDGCSCYVTSGWIHVMYVYSVSRNWFGKGRLSW